MAKIINLTKKDAELLMSNINKRFCLLEHEEEWSYDKSNKQMLKRDYIFADRKLDAALEMRSDLEIEREHLIESIDALELDKKRNANEIKQSKGKLEEITDDIESINAKIEKFDYYRFRETRVNGKWQPVLICPQVMKKEVVEIIWSDI
jgi:peptidoglycan hydrolase CwlO-like protein